MGSRPNLEEKDKSINDYNDEYTDEFNEEIEFIDEETNPEIPLNSEGDSKNLEDELFELARLKLWSSGVPSSSTIEENDKTIEDNQRALEADMPTITTQQTRMDLQLLYTSSQ